MPLGPRLAKRREKETEKEEETEVEVERATAPRRTRRAKTKEKVKEHGTEARLKGGTRSFPRKSLVESCTVPASA